MRSPHRTHGLTNRRFTSRMAAAVGAVLIVLALCAAPAFAGPASPSVDSIPATEVCAPGAMTITRDGPVVLDGVDCTPGPMAGGQTADPNRSETVPSATVLRPMDPPAYSAPVMATTATASSTTEWPAELAGPATGIVAAFAGVTALLTFARRRQAVLFADGVE